MNLILKQIHLIERIDQLIRMQATGSPDALAHRLRISRAKLYRILDVMKSLDAPVHYDIAVQSFVYEEEVSFRFGFFTKGLSHEDHRTILGGYAHLTKKLQFFKWIS